VKATTAEALQSILDSQLIWRRREISSLVSLSKSAAYAEQKAVIRAAVPMLYAHWEAFGKECGVRYLEFVSYRRLAYKELKPSFLYLKMYPSVVEIAKGGASNGIERLWSIQSALSQKNKDPFRGRVSTHSNLRSEVLQEILSLCGLDCEHFQKDKDFIDDELCDPRNDIAHGKDSAPSFDAFVSRRDRAFELMTELQRVVVNAALNGGYRAATP